MASPHWTGPPFAATVGAGLPQAADLLAQWRGTHRVAVIVAAPGDERAAEQRRLLDADRTGMAERDVAVLEMTPDSARKFAPGLGVAPGTAFMLLLVGKDGEVKLRRRQVVPARVLQDAIDAMPMRRREMRQGG